MLKTIFKYNVLNNDFQPVTYDDSYQLNPERPFVYRFFPGYNDFFFLVPNYFEEIGNA